MTYPAERNLGSVSIAATQTNELPWYWFVRVDLPDANIAGAINCLRFTDHPDGDQSLNLDGAVKSLTLLTAGAGYTSAPTVTISAPPSGVQATAIATVSGGVVTGVYITNPGTGYTSNPTVTFTGGGGTTQATASASVTGTWMTSDANGLVVDALDQSEQDPLSVSAISFSNIDNRWTNYANTVWASGFSGLRGVQVRIWQGMFDPTSGAFSGGIKLYEGQIDNQELSVTAHLALRPYLTTWARYAPWSIPGPSCMYPYKDPLTCQYTGSEPVGESTCGKTRASCNARGNLAHFGGDDMMPKIGSTIEWYGVITYNTAPYLPIWYVTSPQKPKRHIVGRH